jgi:hypothetical protein
MSSQQLSPFQFFDTRLHRIGNGGSRHYLLKWQGQTMYLGKKRLHSSPLTRLSCQTFMLDRENRGRGMCVWHQALGRALTECLVGEGKYWSSCICFITDLSVMSTLERGFMRLYHSLQTVYMFYEVHQKFMETVRQKVHQELRISQLFFKTLNSFPIVSYLSIKMQRICPFNVTNRLSCFLKIRALTGVFPTDCGSKSVG